MKKYVLQVDNIKKSFGGLVAVNNVSLNVEAGYILGIIGPNGAGKTSFLNCLISIYVPEQGLIFFNGEEITGEPTYKIIRRGMSRTFQVPRIFQDSVVMENMLTPVLHLRENRSSMVDRASELLKFVGLKDKEDDLAKELSGGQQKLLEFARSMMLDPDILLLDEPFAGVHPKLKEILIGGIKELHGRGKTIIIVSHDMPSLYKLTKDIIVLNMGGVIARGTPNELQNNSLVVDAYLGG